MAGAPRRIATSLSPAYYISRRSINRGLLGNNRVWRAVFFLIFTRRLLQKLSGSEPKLIAVEKLKPGQFLSVTAIDPATLPKKGRRGR